jgi:DNA-binding winged helix-turn-helix (wHTH) protein
MEGTVFIINQRYTADSLRNEIFDKETGQKSRLEPRLMKLLCILAKHQGNVVKREFIIKEIWADYPGANEGLNQAVSFLRKLLADENKEIICTQPKTGYIFNADISWEGENVPDGKIKYVKTVVIASALLLLLFFTIIRYYAKKNISVNPAKQLYERDDAGMDSIRRSEGIEDSKGSSGNAVVAHKEKNDAAIAKQDSIRQAEKVRSQKDASGAAAKGDSIH